MGIKKKNIVKHLKQYGNQFQKYKIKILLTNKYIHSVDIHDVYQQNPHFFVARVGKQWAAACSMQK